MTDAYSREFSKVRQKYSLEDGRNVFLFITDQGRRTRTAAQQPEIQAPPVAGTLPVINTDAPVSLRNHHGRSPPSHTGLLNTVPAAL